MSICVSRRADQWLAMPTKRPCHRPRLPVIVVLLLFLPQTICLLGTLLLLLLLPELLLPTAYRKLAMQWHPVRAMALAPAPAAPPCLRSLYSYCQAVALLECFAFHPQYACMHQPACCQCQAAEPHVHVPTPLLPFCSTVFMLGLLCLI